MAVPQLPGVEEGRNQTETIQNLFDAYVKLRREVEFLLNNLDSTNVKTLDANVTRIKNLKAELVVTNTLITNFLYATEGRIARLTVDHLLSEDILSGALQMNYVEIKDQYIRLIQADRRDDLPQVQYTAEDETTLLYWKDDTEAEMTFDETAYPVMVYQYDRYIKREIGFSEVDGLMVPLDVFGVGTGTGNNGKGRIFKDVDEFKVEYLHGSTGESIGLRMDNDGMRKVGGTGDVQVRNVAISNDSPEDIPGLEDNDQQIRPDDHSSYDVQDVAEDTLLEAGGPAFVRVANGSTITLYNGLSTYNRVQNEETVCGMEIRIIRNIGDTNVTVTPGANQDYASDIVIVPGAERAFYIGYYPSGL